MEKLPPTIELTIFSMFIAMLIAVPLGLITALKRDQPADYIGSVIAVLGISIPGFLLGILLILFLAVEWRVFPASGYGGSFTHAFWTLLYHRRYRAIAKKPALYLSAGCHAWRGRCRLQRPHYSLSNDRGAAPDYVRYAQRRGFRLGQSIFVTRFATRSFRS